MTQIDPNSRFPLSVIILTCNEDRNIRACLASVAWAEDVIVVDSGSVDATIEVARQTRPDVRVFTHPFQDFGDQRNWALDQTDPMHEWILFLDADEVCNDACAQAIREKVANPGGRVGFFLCYKNFFLGRWIKHCTLYPTWQLRLLLRGQVRYRKEGHGQREVLTGPTGYINSPYDHYGFSKGVNDWIARHNNYSTNEVQLIRQLATEPLNASAVFSRDALVRRRCLKRFAARFGFRPIARFFYLFILRGGFLDGRPGFLFCLLRVAHEIHITVKLAEMKQAVKGSTTRGEPEHQPYDKSISTEARYGA